MKSIPARPLTGEERRVLSAALAMAPAHELALATDIDALRVVGLCGCGCRSIYFVPGQLGTQPAIEGYGQTANGRSVEVMLWATDGRLMALDIVDHESTGMLPTPESITSWDAARK